MNLFPSDLRAEFPADVPVSIFAGNVITSKNTLLHISCGFFNISYRCTFTADPKILKKQLVTNVLVGNLNPGKTAGNWFPKKVFPKIRK